MIVTFRNLTKALLLLISVFFSASALAADKIYKIGETESILIKLDENIQRALIGNSELASLQVINNRELLISGQKSGRTELLVWYRNNPNNVRFEIRVVPNQAREAEIEEALIEILADLDSAGGVKFDIRPAWIDPSSSIRRSIDQVGGQIDDDAKSNKKKGADQDIKQEAVVAGSLDVTPLAGNYLVVLKGEVANEALKKRINSVISALGVSVVNMIKVTGPNQIQLSVRVAEVTKGNPFRMGVNIQDKRDRFGLLNNTLPSGGSILLGLEDVVSGGRASMDVTAPHSDAFQIFSNPKGSNLLGVLSILEEHNLSRVLARPELVVQSGETASFLVGGEVPVPVSQGTSDTISVTFKEFGVRVRFSPLITEDGRIQMRVEPEISNIDPSSGSSTGSVTVPGFRTRKVSSTVTVESGQSFVIGGLIQDEIMSTVRKVPLLGDIPILGALFRSTSYDKNQSELAVLVSAKFVEPINKDADIALPGENLDKPNMWWGLLTSRVVTKLKDGKQVLPEQFYKIGLEQP